MMLGYPNHEKGNMKNYFLGLYQSFLRIHGVPVILLGICLGVISFIYSPTDSLSLKVVVPISIVSFLLLVTLIDNSIQNFKKISNILPKVKQARVPPSLYSDAIAILLLEPSDIFAHETLVSIYYLENDFESLIGVGFILTIQENGLIQVLVKKAIEEQGKNIWESICRNDVTILSKLQVKPSIPKVLDNWGE